MSNQAALQLFVTALHAGWGIARLKSFRTFPQPFEVSVQHPFWLGEKFHRGLAKSLWMNDGSSEAQWDERRLLKIQEPVACNRKWDMSSFSWQYFEAEICPWTLLWGGKIITSKATVKVLSYCLLKIVLQVLSFCVLARVAHFTAVTFEQTSFPHPLLLPTLAFQVVLLVFWVSEISMASFIVSLLWHCLGNSLF